ncbi:MAG: DUF3078 domain-containing protein [Bacteroidia bacterium]|nr:DUF3078 domain-containing protein [Bacteroidia bacterium]NNC84732.1 DUF3078 domain-containing protein [Bacteroidia bacterium]
MKNLLIIGLAFVFGICTANAQDGVAQDTSWKKGATGALNFNQISLTNWAGGGENSLAGALFVTGFANHAKNRFAWDNVADVSYGLIKPGSDDIRKNEDKFEINSKAGYRTSETSKWYYTALGNFKSQFAEGFLYGELPNGQETKVLNSNFMAPGYFLGALGMDYKPSDNFTVFISPVTSKFTFVTEDKLSDEGAYGVDPGETSRSEFGGYANARYTVDLKENINLLSKLDLFSNYGENPDHIDVNLEVLIAAQLTKFLSASFGIQALYDHDITVPKTDEDNRPGKGTQFKQVIGIGLSHSIGD